MTKKSAIPALLLVAVCVWTSLAGPSQSKDKRRIEEQDDKPRGRAALSVAVEQIRVDVTVQNKDGNLVEGLQKHHFKIYEDKVLQEITNFTPIEAPITVVLVAEYSRVVPWEFLYEVLVASYTFVEQMRKEDWVAVVAYDIKPEILVDFTQNRADVHNALRRLNFPAFRESNLYDAVFDTLDRLEENQGKTAIVLVTSGLDTFSKKNLDEMLSKVKKTSVVIYPVSTGGNFRARYEHYLEDMARMDFYQADATLKAFAKFTGGHAFFPRFIQEFPGIFETISQLLRHQYSLAYVSTNTKKDGKFRKIRVEVEADIDGDGKADPLKVSHREGYTAEKAQAD